MLAAYTIIISAYVAFWVGILICIKTINSLFTRQEIMMFMADIIYMVSVLLASIPWTYFFVILAGIAIVSAMIFLSFIASFGVSLWESIDSKRNVQT
jgi:hypothetical protein